MESSTSFNEQPSPSDISKTQVSVEEKHESSHSDDARSSLSSVLVSEQAPSCQTSHINQAVDENCDVGPSDDAQLKPFPSSANEPTTDHVESQAVVEEKGSETYLKTKSSFEENLNSGKVQPVLVSGTVSCLNLEAAKDITCYNTEKSPDEAIPFAVCAPNKSIEKYDHRTSKYHGVTRHFWTGKFEAHLWDNSYIREGHRRKGKQALMILQINTHTGQYDNEEKAAQAYDLVALKYWGPSASTKLNFPVSSYEKQLEEMNHMSREEFVMYIRRKSCFKKGSSVYRGVTRHGDGRWQARISGIPGRKGLHLGTFSSEEEAARVYDIASIKYRGLKAFTNFDVSNYSEVDSTELEEQPEPQRLKKEAKITASTITIAKSDPQPDVRTLPDVIVSNQ